MTDTEPNPQAAPTSPEIVLQQIYLKDCSYEAPNGPRIPSAQWNPKFSLNLNTASTEARRGAARGGPHCHRRGEGRGQRCLSRRAQASGRVHGAQLHRGRPEKVIGSVCPTVLFPYARAACSDLITQGASPVPAATGELR